MENQGGNQDINDETILHQAVKTKDVNNVADILLNNGRNFINSLNQESKTPIHIAIDQDLDEIVQLFLSTARVEIADNQFLIHYAIAKGNIKIVKTLVEHFSVEMKNKDGMTAFCIAVQEEKFEILDYLLNLPSNVKINNQYALFYVSIIAGNIALVKKYLELKFPICNVIESSPNDWHVVQDHVSFTPIHLAVKYLRLNVIELLLNEGVDISKKNQDESTALHLAFEAKIRGIWKTWLDVETNDRIIDLLLDVTGSNSAKFTNKNGISHLHAACSRDKPEVIEKFLQENSISGNDFATSDKQGYACLHFAARYRCLEVAKVVLQYGVDVNQRNDEYRTPLHIASKQTSSEFVQLLMQFGADLTLKDCYGNTPVHLAFNDRNYAILNLLFTNPTITSFNPTDSVGISHFHIACTRNDVGVIKKFINAGVAVNLQVPVPPPGGFRARFSKYNKDLNWHGCTPLHFAAAFNRLNIVQILLMNGAHVNGRDNKGYSPMHVACQQNYDRFGDLVTETLQKWKIENSAQTLEWMEVQLLNNPYTDVILVDEEKKSKELDPYPRRFLSHSSYIEVMKTEDIKIIDWELNRKEQIDMIELLYKHRADLNALDNFGNSALYYIYDLNVHKILDDLNEKLHLDKKLGTTIVRSFLVEMHSRRLCLLKKIFKFGSPINVNTCYNNCSILHYICQESDYWDIDKEYMVKYFLRKKADPNATDDLRLSAPRFTLEDSKEKYYDREDDSIEFKNHSTPLHIVSMCRPNERNLNIMCHLLEADADVNAKQIDGKTALHNLAYHVDKTGAYETISILIDYKVLVDSRDNQGQTALFSACQMKNIVMISNLISQGADMNIEDNDGRTIFHYFDEKLIARLLLENRADMSFTIKAVYITVILTKAKQLVGLPISDKVANAITKLDDYFVEKIRLHTIREKVQANLEKHLETLRNTKVIGNISLRDVIFLNEHYLSRSLILEHLEQIIYSIEYGFINISCYINFIYIKLDLAKERKNLLPMAMNTMSRVLSTTYPAFPVVCSDLILAYLTNRELINFIQAYADLTGFVLDNSRINARIKIGRALEKYLKNYRTRNLVVDLIISRM